MSTMLALGVWMAVSACPPAQVFPPRDPFRPPPSGEEEAKIAAKIVGQMDADSKDRRSLVAVVLDDDYRPGSPLMRVLDGLTKGLEESAMNREKRLSVALVALSEKSSLALKPTTDLAAFRAAIPAIVPKNQGRYKNTLDAVRSAAAALQAVSNTSYEAVVLLTDANGDSEDNLEKTVGDLKSAKIQFFAAAPEAMYSDHYWSAYQPEPGLVYDARTRKATKLGFTLYGQESACIEFPYVWFFMTRGSYNWAGDFTITVPSGSTYYGLARLAAETKGAAHVLPSDATVTPFCLQADCGVCRGTHRECDPVYDEVKLKMTLPGLESRPETYSEMRKNPSWRFIFQVWDEAFKKGIVGFGPPRPDGMPVLRASDGRVARGANRGDEFGGLMWSYSAFRAPGVLWNDMYGSNWRQKADEATRHRAEVQRLAETVRKAMDQTDRSKMEPRALATAEALLTYLEIGKMNYQQWEQYCRERERKKDVAVEFVERGTTIQSTVIRDYIRYTFCHGGTALKNLPIEGEAEARKDWEKSCEFVQEAIDRHRGTPWEILMRRSVILGWEAVTTTYNTATTAGTPQRGGSTRTPNTPTPSNPTATPTPPSRPSRPRTTGSTTGTTATPGR